MPKKKNQFHGIGAKTTCGFNKQRIDLKHQVSRGLIEPRSDGDGSHSLKGYSGVNLIHVLTRRDND